MTDDGRKLKDLTRDELCELVVELADFLDYIKWGDQWDQIRSKLLRERIQQLRRED